MNLDGIPVTIADRLRHDHELGARWWVAYHPERPRGILRQKGAAFHDWKARGWNAFGGLQPQSCDVSADIPDVLRFLFALPDPRYPDWTGYTRLALRHADERLVVLETSIGLAGPGFADVTDDGGAPCLRGVAPREPELVMWTFPAVVCRT